MTNLKDQVEAFAKESGISILKAITAMQSVAAQIGNDEVLEALCDMKWDYI